MKITKELKYATFEWDDEEKTFTLWSEGHTEGIKLNKVYAFAFMRFVIRMAQRNWFKKVIKEENKPVENLPVLDDEAVAQLAFCLEESNEDCPELSDDKMEELLTETRNQFTTEEESDLPF